MKDYYSLYKKQNDYGAEIEEYKNYRRMYYDKNAQCPIDTKILVHREDIENGFILSCEKKKASWRVEIKYPVIKPLTEIKNEKNMELKVMLDKVKMGIMKGDYPNKDVLTKVDEIKGELGSIENIYDDFVEQNKKLIEDRKEVEIKAIELRKRLKDTFSNCKEIDNQQENDLMKIFKDEGVPNQMRMVTIARTIDIDKNELKVWFEYFQLLKEYLLQNEENKKINEKIRENIDNRERVKREFIISPPIIKKNV